MCVIINTRMNYFERAKYFRTKKRLGQNFLIDGEVIQDIIEYANIQPDDTVVEIGPGVGFVTEQLIKYAKKVIAIELDEEAIKELEKLKAPNLEIIHKDILKTDLSELCEGQIKVVANIPYYITSPIIAHLLGEIDDLNNKNRNKITDIILMVQEEVARRMAYHASLNHNSDYGVGITGKLNKADENNPYGDDNIVYVSVYDRGNNSFFDKRIEVEHDNRIDNKQQVIDETEELLYEILYEKKKGASK